MTDLFDPVKLGAIECANRVIMAPMTRSRANPDGSPTNIMTDYYAQRAGAGLIISEGVYPSADGKGYVRTPGIVSEADVAGWAKVADAVHDRGGKIVMQIMHCGRIASHHNKDADARTLAPSAIQAKGEMYTDAAGMVPFEKPEAMTDADITRTISDYAKSARLAREAGFDGVELHGTSGYLIAQFLSTGTNKRNDQWGGSLENRLRFAIKVLEAMSAEIGSDRVGLRICPGNPFNDLSDDDPEETFRALIEAINPMGLAYLHVIRMAQGVDNIALAKAFNGPVILNDSYDRENAQKALDAGEAGAISFGRPFIANPDLVERMRNGRDLAKPDFKTLYTPGPEGYSDY